VKVQPISIAGLRCVGCGSADVALIDPGAEPKVLIADIYLTRGRPVSGRCLACWPVARAVLPARRRRRNGKAAEA